VNRVRDRLDAGVSAAADAVGANKECNGEQDSGLVGQVSDVLRGQVYRRVEAMDVRADAVDN
jgi:hypothetical protein